MWWCFAISHGGTMGEIVPWREGFHSGQPSFRTTQCWQPHNWAPCFFAGCQTSMDCTGVSCWGRRMPQNRATHSARHSWVPQNCSTLGTPYTIGTHDDGIRCQQVLSLSPECWTKTITEEIAVVGRVYCLSLRDSVVQYHSINATVNIAFTLLCVGHTVFGRGEPGCFQSFDCRFKCGSYERS